MLKQMIKSCLVVSMAIAVAAPAMAVDINVTGRTRTWLENVAVKDSTTTMQFKAEGRLGASVSGKAGSYTITAFQNVDMDSDDGTVSPTIREQNVTLENDSFGVTLGRSYPYGVTKGMKYAPDVIANSFWVGENLPTTCLTDHLTVNLKSVGVTAIVGLNNYNDSSTAGDARNETVLGAIYGGQFGPVDLGVQILSESAKIDDKDSDATKGGQYDGQSYSSVAFGAGYGISDTMTVSLNYESNSTQSGVSGSDAVKTSIMEFWFDLGLSEDSGISIGYGMKELDDSSANKTKNTMTNLSYAKTMGPATLFVSYYNGTEKDDDISVSTSAKTDSSETKVGAGVVVEF